MKLNIVFLLIGFMIAFVFAGPEFDTGVHEKLAKAKEQRVRNMLRQEQALPDVETVHAIDIVHYDLQLDFDINAKVLYGKVGVTALVNVDAISMMGLNMWDGLVVDSIVVSETQQLLNYSIKGAFDMLMISLDREYRAGEYIQFQVVYHGKPQNSGYRAFDFSGNGNSTNIWSLSEPFGARSWWPCRDTPSDKADSVDIHLTVPNNMIAVSNGTLRSAENHGEKTTWWWHEQYPITTYLVSVAIHEYEIHYDNYIYNDGADTMAIEFYNYPGNYQAQKKDLDKVKHMIEFLSDIYGQYPFIKEKYGHADYGGGGAMEHQTCSSFSFWGEEVFVHELAHQWCGDLITCDSWEHIWLNEGFATYSEALWYEHAYTNVTASKYQMRTVGAVGEGTVIVEDPLNDRIFDAGLSYNKGSWILHMLRHVVGDSSFFNIMKYYFGESEYRFNSATTEQFRDLCEQISGMDLDTFFHQWIYEPGRPVYQVFWDWEPLPDETYRVFGFLKQVQTLGPVFEMPIDITILQPTLDTLITIQNNISEQPFEFIVQDVPLGVIVDKDNWILKEVEYLSRPDIKIDSIVVTESLGNQNGVPEAGEQIYMQIQIENLNRRLKSVDFLLSSDEESVEILENTWQVSDWIKGDIMGNDPLEIKMNITDKAYPHLVKFKMQLLTDGDFELNYYFYFPIGIEPLLYVDDSNSLESQLYFETLLKRYNIFYEKWETALQGPPELDDKLMVIWSTGNETDSTFTTREQGVIREYLDKGGRMLICGQHIGFDLVENGTVEDSLFYSNILNAEYAGRETDFRYLYGIGNTLFENSVLLSLLQDKSNYNFSDYPEIIVPMHTEDRLFKYNNTANTSGIYFHNEINDSKLIYLSFGLEGISTLYDPNAMQKFVNGTLMWFMDSSKPVTFLTEEKENLLDYKLGDNYPNPFNPETIISFTLSRTEQVTLEIFDITGRKVTTLYNKVAAPGEYSVNWTGKDMNGTQMPSGTYFYRLESKSFSETKKLLLLR